MLYLKGPWRQRVLTWRAGHPALLCHLQMPQFLNSNERALDYVISKSPSGLKFCMTCVHLGGHRSRNLESACLTFNSTCTLNFHIMKIPCFLKGQINSMSEKNFVRETVCLRSQFLIQYLTKVPWQQNWDCEGETTLTHWENRKSAGLSDFSASTAIFPNK